MNENINHYFSEVNEKIVTYSKKNIRLDIEDGKMGLCLYFFKLSRLQHESRYQKIAEKILDDIYSELVSESTKISAYELAQIGMGIYYLIRQKYVDGNLNLILREIDKIIYRTIVFEKNPVTYKMNGIIPVLYFICMRIEKQNKGSDTRFIFEELGIKLFNHLYQSLDLEFYNETVIFNLLNYKLPQFILAVCKIYSLHFYNNRIIETLREISGLISSCLPVFHFNRLYLLWSLLNLKEVTQLNFWDEQIDILANHIDYQKTIYKELRNKDVFIQDGITGIYLLLNALKNTSHPIPFDKFIFQKRIEESIIWKDENTFENLGLLNGLGGLLWVYYSIINEK